MESDRPRYYQRRSGSDELNEDIDWFLWQPCTNEPPLAEYRHMLDGTYSLEDVNEMHRVMAEIDYMRSRDNVGSD